MDTMKPVSFVLIQNRISEIINENSIEAFYFGVLREKIISEFEVPLRLDLHFNWILENYIILQQRENTLKSSIDELKEQIDGIQNQIKDDFAKIRKIEKSILNLEGEINELPAKEKKVEDDKDKLKNEIQLLEPLAVKEPYKSQYAKLIKEKESLDKWLVNRKFEEDIRLEKINKRSEEIAEINQVINDKNLKISDISVEIGKTEKEITNFSFKKDDEIIAIRDILRFFYGINTEADIARILNKEIRWLPEWAEKVSKLIKLGEKFESPVTVVKSHNLEFLSSWRSILATIFFKRPDFSQAKYINDSIDFPNFNFEIWDKIDRIDLLASIWLGLRQALKNGASLTTEDGKIYLWVTNSIITEINIRKHTNLNSFIGLYATRSKEKGKYICTKENYSIISGYSNAGFILPLGLYCVGEKVTIELIFYQSALLQGDFNHIITGQQIASSKSLADREEEDYYNSLDDD